MMLGAVLGYTFAVHARLAAAARPSSLALLLCALCGLLVERVAVRPFARARLERLADGDGRARHRARQRGAVHLRQGAARLSARRAGAAAGRGRSASASIRCSSSIPVVGLALAAPAAAVLRDTRHGKALLAVVQNADAARLMGINVPRASSRVRTRCRRLLAGVAGILIAPLFNVHSDMGTLFGIKAFAVAILGGITSAWGVMLAGLIYGLVEALITALLGSTYTQIVTFTLVIVALALDAERPVRPRRGEEGMTMRARASPPSLAIVARRCRPLTCAVRDGYYAVRPGAGRAHGDRRRRPQRAARPGRPGLASATSASTRSAPTRSRS